jgi:hypothetical protein
MYRFAGNRPSGRPLVLETVTTSEGEAQLASVDERRLAHTTRVRMLTYVLLLVLALGTPLAFARAYLIDFDAPGNLLDPFIDATTYRAAGERLNAGHRLYRLEEGDRQVLIIPGLFTAPLLSPPPIAVLWRPLAAVDWGMALWVIACWTALLGTVGYLILRVGVVAMVLTFLLSQAIGEQLAVANAAAFFPMLYVLVWRYRDKPTIGAVIGLMSVIKLAPIALCSWLLSTGRRRALAVAVGSIVGLLLLGAIGAGLDSYVDYLGIFATTRPSPLSISGQTGIEWMSPAVLIGGTAAAIALRRWPRLSYGVALGAAVLGTPALYTSGLVSLLALAAPLIDSSNVRDLRLRRANSDEQVVHLPSAS